MSYFYAHLMEKKAEGNYYSPHLNDRMRRESFDMANQRRAARQTGTNEGRNFGTILGGVGGGLIGLGASLDDMRFKPTLGLLGAGVGAGIGYLAGSAGDKARDARTLEAREILKMSPAERAKVLKYRTADMLDTEDDYERAHRDRVRYEESQVRRARANELRGRSRLYDRF